MFQSQAFSFFLGKACSCAQPSLAGLSDGTRFNYQAHYNARLNKCFFLLIVDPKTFRRNVLRQGALLRCGALTRAQHKR